MSVRAIKRWARASDREAGLVRDGPDRGSGDMAGLGRAAVRWVEMALGEHGKESKPTRGKVIRSVGTRLEAHYGEGEVELPGRATAYRRLQELERWLPTFRLSVKRNRGIAARPPGAYGKLRPARPGGDLLMDTTRLDVCAMDPITMKWVQAELTVGRGLSSLRESRGRARWPRRRRGAGRAAGSGGPASCVGVLLRRPSTGRGARSSTGWSGRTRRRRRPRRIRRW